MTIILFFAFLAGTLSIMSPCVLPLLPIVLGGAATKSRYGPFLLSLGLVLSFVTIGLFISLVGFSIGLDGNFFRNISAVFLIAAGLLLAVTYLQKQFTHLLGPMSNWLNQRLNSEAGLGQFGLGIVLGAVWSPCVGPTLGAASVLAAQGKNIGQVALTMAIFGLGVAVPLLLIGLASRELMQSWRGKILTGSVKLKTILGVFLIIIGVGILSGQDKALEATLVELSPDWLTRLTTRF